MKKIRTSLVLLGIFPMLTQAFAEDAIYGLKSRKPTKITVENDSLLMRMDLKKIPLPKAKRIILFSSDGADAGNYTIQIDLVEKPPEDLIPIIFVVGESTIMEGVGVGGTEQLGYSITLGTNDKAVAADWFKRLKALFKIKDENARDRTKNE